MGGYTSIFEIDVLSFVAVRYWGCCDVAGCDAMRPCEDHTAR